MTIPDGSMIRRALPTDAAAIIAVLDATSREGVMLTEPGQRTVAQQAQGLTAAPSWAATWIAVGPSGRITGTAEALQGATPKTSGLVTVALALAPEARRQGLGARLMQTLEAWAHERHAHKIALSCLSTNRGALDFYHALGYHEEGRRRAQYWVQAQWADEVWFGKWWDEAVGGFR